MASETENASKRHVQFIRDHPFPVGSYFLKKNVEDAMDYIPKDDDVIIASYPKTGTTWLQYIIMQVVSNATVFHTMDDLTFKIHPFIELAGTAAVEALTGNRTYKHHIPYNMVKKNDKSKYIYIYRHPEDTLVSFYYFYQNLEPDVPFAFEDFFENFVTGNIGYGSYFKHVLSFYEHCSEPNLLMVSYEKLYVDRKQEILRIAKFLNNEHYKCLAAQEDVIDKIIEHTSFEYMKKNLYLTHPKFKDSKEKKHITFFRKGIVGDGRNTLSENQRQRIKEAAKLVLEGRSIFQEWYPDEN